MWASMDNARKVGYADPGGKQSRPRKIDRRRKGIPTPLRHMVLQMAERFGVLPWQIAAAPMDEVLPWIGLMSLEAEIKDAIGDLGPEDFFERGD